MENFYTRSKKLGFLTLLVGLLFSCNTNYQIARVSRQQYAISPLMPLDSGLVRTYLPYKQELDAKMNEVIGQSALALSKDSDLPESTLGNFFAEACFTEAKKLDSSIDFAMPTTKGGMRSIIPKGPVTLRNIYELMPFENELLVVELTGPQVQEVLNFIAAAGGEPVSGITMQISNGKPENVLIGQNPFRSDKNYHVLTSDYLAGGGDNARGLGRPVAQRNVGLKVRDALIRYVKNQNKLNKSISATLDGRITKK